MILEPGQREWRKTCRLIHLIFQCRGKLFYAYVQDFQIICRYRETKCSVCTKKQCVYN